MPHLSIFREKMGREMGEHKHVSMSDWTRATTVAVSTVRQTASKELGQAFCGNQITQILSMEVNCENVLWQYAFKSILEK